MHLPILSTKLYIPQLKPKTVFRTSLIELLNKGSRNKLTLISASAGFGKTTLICQWIEHYDYSVGWISLDEEHNDLIRFLLYLLGAIKSAKINIDESILGMILSPQPPKYKTILTFIINEIANLEDDFSLVLDDYHLIDSIEVNDALTFLIDNMPSQMHLIISTRVEPCLPIARLRARGQIVEVRIADMRFKQSEIAELMNQILGFKLIEEDISALKMRTEGWIAGIKLAAISMQSSDDIMGFIESFTGSNRYIIDYLVEEVLNRLPKHIKEFLFKTSVLDRMCGPLCDHIFPNNKILGQETLEHLERINMFIIPLDSERRWYRYHHLFAEILRQRMANSNMMEGISKDVNLEDLHLLASSWYEKNDLFVEAFIHATKAKDIDLAQRLIKGNGIPLQYKGALTPILSWLNSLEKNILDSHPSLWVTYASILCMMSKFDAVEDKLGSAELALDKKEQNSFNKDLIGHIASNRAFLAVTQRNVQEALSQSKRALEYLHPENIAVRTSNNWILGMAYCEQGNLDCARSTLEETIRICNSTENYVVGISAKAVLGLVYEQQGKLHLAAKTYQKCIKDQGSVSYSTASYFSHIGLARIFYKWNNIEKALNHCEKSIELSKQLVNTDIIIACKILLAQIKIFNKDFNGAASILDKAYKTAKLNKFIRKIPEIISAKVLVLIKQGKLPEAYRLVKDFKIPIYEARIYLAKNEGYKAISLLEPMLLDIKKTGQEGTNLEILILLSLAYHKVLKTINSKMLLEKAMILAEPDGNMRDFIDEGEEVVEILKRTSVVGKVLDYKNKLLDAFALDKRNMNQSKTVTLYQPLTNNLSKREIEVLELISQGLSNREICEELFLAIDTVKGHNRRIYGKLGVNNRTSAIKRASSLGIINM